MKKWLKILLCTLLIFGAFIFLKNQFAYLLYQNASSGLAPLIKEGKSDHLFIGSSMFKQGIDANALSSSVGEEAYLLSYNGNQPITELELLHYLIEHGVEIRTLYLDLYLFAAEADFSISDNRLFLDTEPAFKMRLLSHDSELSFSAVYEAFVTANNDLILTWPISYPLINRLTQRGSSLTVKSGVTAAQLENISFASDDKPLNQDQVSAMREIIALCREKGIRLVLIETPKYIGLVDKTNYTERLRGYVDAIDDEWCSYWLLDSFGETERENIHLYSFDNSNPEYYIDTIHLSSEGRNCLTKVLRKMIAASSGLP